MSMSFRPFRSPTGWRPRPHPMEMQSHRHQPFYLPVGLKGGGYLNAMYGIRLRWIPPCRQNIRRRTLPQPQRRNDRLSENPSKHPHYTYIKTAARYRYPRPAPIHARTGYCATKMFSPTLRFGVLGSRILSMNLTPIIQVQITKRIEW